MMLLKMPTSWYPTAWHPSTEVMVILLGGSETASGHFNLSHLTCFFERSTNTKHLYQKALQALNKWWQSWSNRYATNVMYWLNVHKMDKHISCLPHEYQNRNGCRHPHSQMSRGRRVGGGSAQHRTASKVFTGKLLSLLRYLPLMAARRHCAAFCCLRQKYIQSESIQSEILRIWGWRRLRALKHREMIESGSHPYKQVQHFLEITENMTERGHFPSLSAFPLPYFLYY